MTATKLRAKKNAYQKKWAAKHPSYGKPYARAWARRNARRVNQEKRGLRLERKLRLIAMNGGKCLDCGFAGHHTALDFDHRDASAKSFNVGSIMVHSWDRVVAEAAKCDLVCANCHRVRTYIRRGAA